MVLTALLKERAERTKLLEQQLNDKDLLINNQSRIIQDKDSAIKDMGSVIQKLEHEKLEMAKEMARSLLADGFPVEFVMKHTHLSAEDIQKLIQP